MFMFHKSISYEIICSIFVFIVVVQKMDPIKCFFIQQITCPQALLVFQCKYITYINIDTYGFCFVIIY